MQFAAPRGNFRLQAEGSSPQNTKLAEASAFEYPVSLWQESATPKLPQTLPTPKALSVLPPALVSAPEHFFCMDVTVQDSIRSQEASVS